MPTNQSLPWGGAKLRRCTVSPVKVPLSQSQRGSSSSEHAQCEDVTLIVIGRPLSANHRKAWCREAPPLLNTKPTGSQKVSEDRGVSLSSVTNHFSSIILSPTPSEEEEPTGVLVGGAMGEQEAEPKDRDLSEDEETLTFKPMRAKHAARLSTSSSEDAEDTSVTSSSSVVELMSVDDDAEERPALVPSLFPLVPPTLYFSTANEKVELLPVEERRLLKWKLSTVTPNVVKHTITRSHFKITKKSHDWLGCWGHHMKSPAFKTLGEHQKLNHFPGTFQIGRKDRLWRNLSKMQARFGKREFGFFPRTFILPQDIKQLRKAWEGGGSRQTWIIKPPASARGTGIQVIHKWSQMPRKRPLLVQKYLHKPFLISGNKFDLRIYVYVTSYDPLRVYIYSDGLVRFASCKYSTSMKTLSNKFIHLTNYSINKKNSEYQSNSDDTDCQGHKWSLKALWKHLSSQGINTSSIWEKIKDIVVKTIIAAEPYVNSLMKMNVRSAYSCHELFGFDIMLDEKLKPWILEVNISPSLHSNTPLDLSIKGNMMSDVLNLAGFRIPVREEVLSPCSSTCRVRTKYDLSADEKVKRAFYLTQRSTEQDPMPSSGLPGVGAGCADSSRRVCPGPG
ncbi:tubulin monoglutamylase TTLL4 isoform X2 [Gouania willdenowi]|uniref:tubulin monoglutamylase TTLL4 isoform X2 n=1 Tax=Gouania willdenowi TaxID=441366 RepID=UPI0010565ED1|nr:tubulin polyglutamylase TTLL4 isoform X2 [Gouania willdenowi]